MELSGLETNGEGIYSFDGENFKEYKLDHDERGSSVINKLYKDSEGIVWIGTKSRVIFH